MRRGFVELDGLFIHWRAIGQGPALVLLHESPRSSASLIPLMKRLSNDFCCIAFDTPGYGASDPLPEGVKSLTEFACVIRQTIASLGIETFCLYGTHTGAAIALQLAASDVITARRFGYFLGARATGLFPALSDSAGTEMGR